MKNRWSNELKVGIMIIVFAVAGFFVLYFMGDVKKEVYSKYVIQFDQVGGIASGDSVRYAGVVIGKVKGVEISKAKIWDWSEKDSRFTPRLGKDGKQMEGDQAFVTIGITESWVFRNQDPIFTDNTEVTVSTSMMNDRWIEIKPQPGNSLPKDQVLLGRSPVTVEDFIKKAERAVEKFSTAADNVNDIIGDSESQKNIKLSLENFKELTGNLKEASKNAKNKIGIIADKIALLADRANDVLLNVDRQVLSVGGNIQSFTNSLNRITSTNEGDIRMIVKNLLYTSRSLNKTLKSIEGLVTRKEFNEDILGTLRNIKNASQDIEGIASDIRAVTSDGQIREDLKVAVHEARQATAGANKLIKGVNEFLGIPEANGGNGNRDSGSGSGSSESGQGGQGGKASAPVRIKKMLELDVEGEWNSKDGQFSPNVNAVILPMHKSSLKLGVDSLGYDNLFNLQYRMGDGAIKPRIGVVRSKLGLGTDINLGKAAGIYVDAYDPRDVQVDITGRLMMPKDFYLHGGIRDAFDRKNPVFGVGKRF
jgi:phospholipid/cholesterol/gamma-HCH transport system substrate-binding protein